MHTLLKQPAILLVQPARWSRQQTRRRDERDRIGPSPAATRDCWTRQGHGIECCTHPHRLISRRRVSVQLGRSDCGVSGCSHLTARCCCYCLSRLLETETEADGTRSLAPSARLYARGQRQTHPLDEQRKVERASDRHSLFSPFLDAGDSLPGIDDLVTRWKPLHYLYGYDLGLCIDLNACIEVSGTGGS